MLRTLAVLYAKLFARYGHGHIIEVHISTG